MRTPKEQKPSLVASFASIVVVLVGVIVLATVADPAALFGLPAVFYAVARMVVAFKEPSEE